MSNAQIESLARRLINNARKDRQKFFDRIEEMTIATLTNPGEIAEPIIDDDETEPIEGVEDD